LGSFTEHPSDRDLVERCLGKEKEAWEQLTELIQRICLTGVYRGKNSEQAAETAGEVLLALLWNNCEILRAFDPTKGPLNSYLTGVVRHFAQQAERIRQVERSKLKEIVGHQRWPTDQAYERTLNLTVEEFSKRLRGELKRYFFEKHLGILPRSGPKQYSKQHGWKLEQRLREEWKRLFEKE
jgi:hypothetical protein